MRKKIMTTEDRRKLKMILARRSKDPRQWTWEALANHFDFNSASHCYNWVHDRAAEINGTLVPMTDLTQTA